MGGVEDVEDAFPEGPGDDKAIFIQQEAVALKHSVPRLPVRAAQRRVIGNAFSEGRNHLRIFLLICAGHGDVTGGYGD